MKPYEELMEQQTYIVMANGHPVELRAQLSADFSEISYSWTHPITKRECMGLWKSPDDPTTPPVAWRHFNLFMPLGVIAPMREELATCPARR